jgi:nicotinamide-nucleotide amidase
MLADLIQDYEEALPANIKLAYLPNYGIVRLRLTANGADNLDTEKIVNEKFEQLQHLVKEFLVTIEDEPMEKIVGKLLMQKNKTISTAESCTGGYIAHLITSMPGSSAFFEGSIVSYSYRIKREVLGVKKKTLLENGAVSEQAVLEMVKGVLKTMKTDYAIAVSGIMGPDGGTDEKPVGTVWVAVGNDQQQKTQKFHFRFNRQRNIQFTAVNALNMMRKFILENDSQVPVT